MNRKMTQKLLSLILIAVLAVTMLPASERQALAYSEEESTGEADDFQILEEEAVDPDGIIDLDSPIEQETVIDLSAPEDSEPSDDPSPVPLAESEDTESVDPSDASGVTYYSSIAEAGAALRKQMVARQTSIPIGLITDTQDTLSSDYSLIYSSAVSHTGVGNEGDYLDHSVLSKSVASPDAPELRSDGKWYSHVTYNITYLTTAQQEAAVTTEVDRILNSLPASNCSREQKLFLIYSYLVENVRNTENVSSASTHSAYSALINKEAACQGYALAVYRLLLDAGYDARYISGTGYDGSHAWNIVELFGKYYCLDATWDAFHHPGTDYEFYLNGRTSFDAADHHWEAPFTGYAFTSTYPMSDTDFVLADTKNMKGICGDDLTWNLAADGMLVIDGSGRMYDFAFDEYNAEGHNRIPWYSLRDEIEGITIGENITYIGKGAFADLGSCGSITVGSKVTEIAAKAFWGCGFTEINLPSGLKTIGSKSFAHIGALVSVKPRIMFSGTFPTIAEDAFQSSWLTCLYPDNESTWNPVSADPSGYQYGGSEISWMPKGGEGSEEEVSGVIGVLNWKFDYSNGTLTISGSGPMPRRSSEDLYPWHKYRSLIQKVILSPTIQNVSKNALSNCPVLKEVVLPKDVSSSIEEEAFKGCSALSSITFPSNVASVGSRVFVDSGLLKMTFEGAMPNIADSAFESLTDITAYFNLTNDSNWLNTIKNPDQYNFGGRINWKAITAIESDFFILKRDNNSFRHALSNLPSKYDATLFSQFMMAFYPGANILLAIESSRKAGGICEGASVLMSLMQRGYFTGYLGKNHFHDLSSPITEDPKFWKLMSFYHLLQLCPIYSAANFVSPDEKTSKVFPNDSVKTDAKKFLEKLVNEAQYSNGQKKAFVFAYSCGAEHKHAVVCCGYFKTADSDGNIYHAIPVYDINSTEFDGSSEYSYLYISEDYSHFRFVDQMGWSVHSSWDVLKYYGVDKIDAFANICPVDARTSKSSLSSQSLGAVSGAQNTSENSIVLMISAGKSFRLVNQDSEYLASDGDTINGTMSVLDFDFVGENEVLYLIRVNASDRYVLTDFDSDFRFMAEIAGRSYYAKTSSASKITFSKESGLEIEGTEYTYETALSTDFQDEKILFFDGTAKGKTNINATEDGIEFEADDSSDLTITARTITEETPVSVDPDTDHFIISETEDSNLVVDEDTSTKPVTPQSGTFTDTISWSLDSDGTLTISGTGKMTDYGYSAVDDWQLGTDQRPWGAFKSDIRHLVVESGITHIGGRDFYNCPNLQDVVISETVTSIGRSAFYTCPSLKDVKLGKGLKTIDQFAFSETAIETIILPISLTSLGIYVFYSSPLKSLYFKGAAPKLDDETFAECASFTIYTPAGDTSWTSTVKSKTYGCTGTITWNTWTVPTDDLSNCTMSFIQTTYTAQHGTYESEYGGTYSTILPITPNPVIMNGSTLLTRGVDYTLSYSDNYRPGTATCTAKGKGEFSGTITGTFTIVPASISDAVIAPVADCTFNAANHGWGQGKEPTVTLDGIPLSRAMDYNISYTDAYNVGTVTVTLTGIEHNGWKDSAQYIYKIQPAQLSACTITMPTTSYAFTGEEIKPYVSVKLGYTSLRQGEDYSLIYKNNIKPGTGTVTVSPGTKGNLIGTPIKLSFEITDSGSGGETKISLNASDLDLLTKQTFKLKATITPYSSSGQKVFWSSDNPDVVSVDSNGLVTAKKYGYAELTAQTEDGAFAECVVLTRFHDVANRGKYYYEPVYWAVDEGITKCTVSFRPNDSVTRGEFVAFMYRMAGSPKVSKISSSFKDVNSKTKFAKEISWAVKKGIIKGYSDKTFRPNEGVTRAQCALMLWRWAGKKSVSIKTSPFSDIKPADTDTFRAIIWGNKKGIIKGSGGKFLPQTKCSRADVVTFLFRYYMYCM